MSEFEFFLKSIEKCDENYVIIKENYIPVFLERPLLYESSRKPIHLACEKGNYAACKFLIDNGCDLECKDQRDIRPIHLACKSGNLKIIKLLIKQNCDYTALTKKKKSPLYISCKYGHKEIVDLFIKNKCDLDAQGPWLYSPLHIACQYGQVEIVKLLIENYCNIKCLTEFGHEPVHITCRYGQVEVLKYLIECNCSIDDDWSEKPIHLACKYGHIETLRLILERKCSVDYLTPKGQTALHYAAQNGNLEIMKMLLVNQATVDIENDMMETPQIIAAKLENYDCEHLLKDWYEQEKIVCAVRNNHMKHFYKYYKQLNLKEISYSFFGTLLDLSIYHKTNKISDYILNNLSNNKLNVSQILSLTNQSKSLPSRIFQEFLVYQVISESSKHTWNWVVSIDIINGNCTLFGSSFLELAAIYANKIIIKHLMEMLLDIDQGIWEKAVQLAISNNRKEITNLILMRLDYLNTRKIAGMNRLHVAVDDNRLDIIKYLVNNNICDPNDNKSTFGTPLNMAYAYGRTDCIEFLELITKNKNEINECNHTNLHNVIANGSINSVYKLIPLTKNMNARDAFGCSYLHYAIIHNREDIIGELLTNGCDINDVVMNLDCHLVNYLNQTIQSSNTIALSISNVENACSLCLKIFRRLFYYLKRNLGQNQIIQFTDGNGNSFLHISAVLLLPELCHHFIKSGANINQLNSNRNSPLQELLYYHKPNILLTHGDQFYDTVKILASNKTDISNVNLNGMNCFQYSLQYKDEKLIENLIAHSTNVNIEEDDFNFFFNNKWISLLRKLIFMIPEQFITDEILLQSAKIYPFDIFILIWRFCSDEIRMRSVEKLLYQTSNNNKEKIFKFCCEFKINSSRLLDNGETILTALIKEDKSDFCYHILKSTFGKFVIDRPNRDGWTPLHCAAFKYNLNLFEEILNHCSHLYIENNEGETALAILLRKIPQNSDIKHVTHLIKFMIYRNIDIYSLSSTNQRVIDNCQNENLKKEIERIYALKPSNNNL